MKKIILAAYLLLPLFANAQFFSGELLYKKSFIAKKPSFNIDSAVRNDLGLDMTYLITQHYYKSTYFKEGKETYSYTYHDETKRMYDDFADKGYVTYRDSRKGNLSNIRSRIYKDSIKTVAGHRCFMTESIYENHIQRTYYAEDLKIDPETYKAHLAGDWYNQIKAVNGALSLMSIAEFADHIEISEVVKITPKKLSPNDFKLPSRKEAVASFTALDKRVETIPASLATQTCIRKKLEEAPQSETRVVSYVSFIVSEKGNVSHIEPYNKDAQGYYKIAMEIIASCGLEFKPGEISGKPTSSLVFFPVTFGK